MNLAIFYLDIPEAFGRVPHPHLISTVNSLAASITLHPICRLIQPKEEEQSPLTVLTPVSDLPLEASSRVT